jgi:mRNA-degrading endonuclease toxin of MazEF toxin-antitoxin module
MSTTPIELHRGDVVLIAFPFVAGGRLERKRRPALVVQADRYNRRRDAIVIAAITSTQGHRQLPSKVLVPLRTAAGRSAGLRLDSVIDCQTLATVPRSEILTRLGAFPADTMREVARALGDALDLPIRSEPRP